MGYNSTDWFLDVRDGEDIPKKKLESDTWDWLVKRGKPIVVLVEEEISVAGRPKNLSPEVGKTLDRMEKGDFTGVKRRQNGTYVIPVGKESILFRLDDTRFEPSTPADWKKLDSVTILDILFAKKGTPTTKGKAKKK
jgi:hypothetical protein